MAEERKNPFPPGSARAKLWDRREADRKKKEAASKPEAPAEDESEEDKTKRRRALDEAIDRMSSGQRTDSANKGRFT